MNEDKVLLHYKLCTALVIRYDGASPEGAGSLSE